MSTCIATWSFGKLAVDVAKERLLHDARGVDAVVDAIATVEDDPRCGVCVVGRGGCPNAAGVLQCDAALMCADDHSFGGVAAIEGVATPVRVARMVMDGCRHNLLVGAGAQEFAAANGFPVEDNDSVVTDLGRKAYKEQQETNKKGQGHDTLGLIARGKGGEIVAGVSTSGYHLKHPGRVGDSPLPGGGLYADKLGGAACATGDGDLIMKFCPTFHAVHLMRNGASPTEACQTVVKEIVQTVGNDNMWEMGLIAMNPEGEVGASGTVTEWKDPLTGDVYNGFPHAVWAENGDKEEVRVAPDVRNKT